MLEYEDEAEEQDGGAGGVRLTATVLLMDRKTMAKALSMSTKTFDNCRRAGCPEVRVPGRSRALYNPQKVRDWLEEWSATAPGESDLEFESLDEARRKADLRFGT